MCKIYSKWKVYMLLVKSESRLKLYLVLKLEPLVHDELVQLHQIQSLDDHIQQQGPHFHLYHYRYP